MHSRHDGSLIPGLPDHFASSHILSRISWWDFQSALGVSKNWRAALQEERFIHGSSRSRGASSTWGCLHPVAGDDDSCSSRNFAVSVRDPRRGTWETLPPIPWLPCGAPLAGRCACVDGVLFVLGGRNSHNWDFVSDCFSIDLSGGTSRQWRRCPAMATPRAGFACAASSGRIYVAGGAADDKLTMAAAEVYDVRRRRWEQLPDMNLPRTECSAAIAGGRLCVIGGYTTSGTAACELDLVSDATLWVTSADTLRFGATSWASEDDTSEILEHCEIPCGTVQALHPAVHDELARRSADKATWTMVDGRIVAPSGPSDFNLLILAVRSGGFLASRCCSPMRAFLCSGSKLDDKMLPIDCPFDLTRVGTSCFLINGFI